MKVHFWFNWQIGLMIAFGETFEKRPYISIEIPLLIIQISWTKKK